MNKPRLDAIEYIRGVAMLGVIGIHVGAQYVVNPTPNLNLVALFQIITRFAVPIFFFVSAFGLFYHLDLNAPFRYLAFLRRRARTVLVPYLVWSAFYILHYTIAFRDTMLMHVKPILYYLFFGYGSYQLYFMVILLWFYLLMPLWIALVKRLTVPWLATLFALNIAFNHWSTLILTPSMFSDPILQKLVLNRLNYWVMHYLFIFLLGGYLAVHFDAFQRFMEKRCTAITVFFLLTLFGILADFRHYFHIDGYTAIGAVNATHQLCPSGMFYTLGASLFFFTIFTIQRYPSAWNPLFSFLGRHSYFAYLVHPLFITYAALCVHKGNIVFTAPVAIAFYLFVAVGSLLLAVLMRRIGDRYPMVNALTIGVFPAKR